MSENNYTVFNAMTDIITSPGQALDEVKAHTRWLWWPLLISIGLASAVFAWYYSWVDFAWIVEETIAGIPAENRAEAAEGIRSFMKPTTTMLTTIVAIVVMTMLIYLIQSAYLHLANKMTTGAEIGYGQWFSFSAWTAFPNIFGSLAIAVVILLAESNQVSQAELSPLSMNSLLIHAKMGEDWFNWGNSLSLLNFWMLALMTIGYSRWTGASMVKSAVIACLPWTLIFGIWAALV